MKTKLSQHPQWVLIAYASVAITNASISTGVNAQERNPQPPQAAADRQNTGIEGTVDLYLMNPDGHVDGVLLNNNTIVRFPPHLSEQLTATVSPHDPVKVDGFTESTNTIHAWTITDLRTQHSLTDTPPGPGRMPPEPTLARQQMAADSVIRVVTHAPRGEPDGAVLTDGTIVHVPPSVGEEYVDLLQPGKPLAATGFGTTNSYGRSFEATALGPSIHQLQTVATTAPPPRRGRR